MKYPNSTVGTNAALSGGVLLVSAMLTAGMSEGTGGYATREFALNRFGYRNPHFFDGANVKQVIKVESTPASSGLNAEKNLAHIEAILRPSVTELAAALRISRQSIYDWKKGNQIGPDNSEKLRELAAAADAFAGRDEQFIHHILRRKIGGHNFFGRVGNGESPINAAKKLLEIAQTELRQREMISAQLKDRPARTNIIAVPGRHYQDENG